MRESCTQLLFPASKYSNFNFKVSYEIAFSKEKKTHKMHKHVIAVRII